MRSFYTLFLFIYILLALPLTFQAQTLSADNDGDGCVATSDLMTLLSQFGECYSLVTCGDPISHAGYNYSTVQIGDQCWFAENCRYLPVVSPSSEGNETDPYYYVYGYEGTDVITAQAQATYSTYGVLYNWPAVMEPGICPSGWHIPTDLEWQTMEIALGMSASEASGIGWRGTDQGSQMKSTIGWNNGGNGSNSSGLTGLPGGSRYSVGFSDGGGGGGWWSASEAGSNSWSRALSSNYDDVYRIFNFRFNGFSARCVIDYTDGCGVTNGDNSCLDECGVPNGDNSTCSDECGVLNGDNSTCTDCCGVVNGDGSTCVGACGACNDDTSCLDCCGVVNGDGSTCVGACGACNDDTSCLDDCGVPNGDNSTCGCDGVPNYMVSHAGYDYSTVQIGDQCWFSENCRYLPVVSPSSEGNTTDPYYYVYDYEGTDVITAQAQATYSTYGVLYNWPAVMEPGICPSGWHIPHDLEWQIMEIALGMSASEASSLGHRGTDQGSQMKSTIGWSNGGNGSNSSGFTGLPGGYRDSGGFLNDGGSGYWWSASESGSGSLGRVLNGSIDSVYRHGNYRYSGFSARCVRH